MLGIFNFLLDYIMSNKSLRLFKVPLKQDLPPPIPIAKVVDKFAVKKFRKINPKKVFHIEKKKECKCDNKKKINKIDAKIKSV